jgi:hypothetical protein
VLLAKQLLELRPEELPAIEQQFVVTGVLTPRFQQSSCLRGRLPPFSFRQSLISSLCEQVCVVPWISPYLWFFLVFYEPS